MLQVKQCRYKEPFRCICVTHDNVDEFISDCLPWYTINGEKLKRTIIKKNNVVEINYPNCRVNVFLNTWYVNEGYEWKRSTSFDEDYEVIE